MTQQQYEQIIRGFGFQELNYETYQKLQHIENEWPFDLEYILKTLYEYTWSGNRAIEYQFFYTCLLFQEDEEFLTYLDKFNKYDGSGVTNLVSLICEKGKDSAYSEVDEEYIEWCDNNGDYYE